MIGIFDSGLGGLTVVRAIMDRLPGYDIVYFGDTARMPYGSKSPRTVVDYARQDSMLLIRKGARLVLMACNTASSVAFEPIARRLETPVFEVVTPAVETALQCSRNQRIGVIGTRATIGSAVYERKIKNRQPDAAVYSVACPLLVPLVEEGWLRKPETKTIVKKYLTPLKNRQIDTLVLGCTHYPILKHIVQHKIGKQINVIDSSLAVAEKLAAYLTDQPSLLHALPQTGRVRLLVSDITPQFESMAQMLLQQKVELEQVRLPVDL